MNVSLVSNASERPGPPTMTVTRVPRRELPAIFGLRYLEEEVAEIYDVVGCVVQVPEPEGQWATGTGCDDHD